MVRQRGEDMQEGVDRLRKKEEKGIITQRRIGENCRT